MVHLGEFHCMRTLRKGSKHRDRQLRSRQRILAVLEKLGIPESAIRALPERQRHVLYDFRGGGISVELAPGAAKYEFCRDAAEYLNDTLRTSSVTVPGTDRKVPLCDYAGPLQTLWIAARSMHHHGLLDPAAAQALKPLLDISPEQLLGTFFETLAR